jgi:hypothetical protein
VLPTESSFVDGSLTKHLAKLKMCDAFLIFYDAGSADWLAEKLDDYRQYLRGRTRRVLAKAVYVASADKGEVRTNEAIVLRAVGKFLSGDIHPLLERLRAVRQAVS